jgi:predicted RNase H-like HicB family nuclease
MSKPNYRATLIFDTDRKVFIARAPELEHCTAEGATRAEALTKLEEEIDAQLANMLSHGSTPPRAADEEVFSGEITAKVSRGLHRELAYQARSEGIDIDHLVGELLSAAMESRKQNRGVRSGNRAQPEHHAGNDSVGNRYEGGGGRQRGFGGRGGNAHLLDDRANFIEYVRGLEQGPPNRHGGGGHGGQQGGGGRGGRGGGRGGRGGRGGNPNHGQHRGVQGGGGPRPQGNGTFAAGNGSAAAPHANGGGFANNGGGHEEGGGGAQDSSHDPDSSGNV